MTKLVYSLKHKLSKNLKSSLTLVLTLLSPILINAASCAQTTVPGGQPPDITFKGRPFATDSRTQSIVRMDDGRLNQIMTNDPRFDNRVVFTLEEYERHLQDIEAAVQLCERWKPTTKRVLVDPYLSALKEDFNEVVNLSGIIYNKNQDIY